MERDLQDDFDFFQIRQLAFDPWNAQHTATRLASYGFKMVEFAQTIRNFTEICKQFEANVKSRRIEHNAHPVLAWNAENITVKTDASGNVRPVKPEHGDTKRIDGLVAALMACWGLLGAKDDEDCEGRHGRELDL